MKVKSLAATLVILFIGTQGTSLGESMSDPYRLGPWGGWTDRAGGEGEF